METVIVLVVFSVIFVIIMMITSKKWKNSYLDLLELLENEKIIFEDEKVMIELKAGPGEDRLPGAYVRMTNQRIIIAQKVLFKDKYFMKYIIHYTGLAIPEGTAGGAFKTGFITYQTNPSKISYIEDKKPYVQIEPSINPGIGVPVWLKIYTDKMEEYKKVFS